MVLTREPWGAQSTCDGRWAGHLLRVLQKGSGHREALDWKGRGFVPGPTRQPAGARTIL